MSDYDPNVELESQDDADAYVNWCAEQFVRLATSGNRSYRTATRCSAWLFVVAIAQLHLDEEVCENRDELLESLSAYVGTARLMERQQVRIPVERLIIMRGSLDCWEAVGEWAAHLLDAAKCALAARLLIDFHPLVDLWEVEAPDAWALLETGMRTLAEINLSDGLTFGDYAVRPSEANVARYTWQRARNLTRNSGLRVDLSGN